MDSILTSIKKLLGIPKEVTHFNADLIMHINSVFMILSQIGIGPSSGFSITGEEAVWTDFIPAGYNLELVKSYMYQKVRLLFDPPLGSAVMEAANRMIGEFEWRLQVAADSINAEGKEGNQNGTMETGTLPLRYQGNALGHPPDPGTAWAQTVFREKADEETFRRRTGESEQESRL